MRNRVHARRLIALAVAGLAAVVATPAGATVDGWTGAVDSSWLTLGNWTAGLPAAADTVSFDAGSTANLATTLGADITILGLAVSSPSGPVSITNNVLTLGAGGIDRSTATQNLTISSGLSTAPRATQIWNVNAGVTLDLNTGTFARGVGSTLNLRGAGTVTASKPGLVNTNGILGAWATVGSGTALSYATLNAGQIVGSTGTATFTNATNSATTNYDVAANVSIASGSGSRSANTIRNTAASTITVATNRHLQLTGGLLNAGTGAFNVVQSGSSTGVINPLGTELVLTTNTQAMTISAPITNQNFGAGVTAITIVSQGGLVTLSPTGGGGASSTFTGGVNLNAGTLALGANSALGVGGTLTMASGTTLSTALAARTITNPVALAGLATLAPAAGFAVTINGIVSGSGSLTKSGATVTLGAANTYTGATNVSAGTLAVAGTGALNGGTSTTIANGAAFNLDAGADYVFNVLAGGSSNTVAAPGTGVAVLDGDFVFNLPAVGAVTSDTVWQIENVATLTGVYGANFTVPGFTPDAGSDIWTLARTGGETWTFTEADGRLSLAVIPEPASLGLLGVAAAGLISRRRRRA